MVRGLNRNIHKLVLTRLLAVWLVMTPVMLGVLVYVEFKQVDNRVLELALNEAAAFDQQLLDRMPTADEATRQALQEVANRLVDHHFVLVDIYDIDQSHLASSVDGANLAVQKTLDAKHHQFPLNERLHYEKFELEGHIYMQVLIPLMTSTQSVAGYFEGVYQVDDRELEHIEREVYHLLMMVVVVVSMTTLALYPIILYLNRQLIKFSGDVFRANLELMKVMGASIAKRDHTTDAHNYRVTLYAVEMGRLLDFDVVQMRHLLVGAFLHDVGKIGVSDAILRKDGPLTESERAQMREHVRIGLDIVADASWLEGAREVIQYHHEKYDGSGYLEGLAGEAIPINARIFAIVDVFDALMSSRPYKKPYTLGKALDVLEEGRGSHFDPELLDLFVSHAAALHGSIGGATYFELTNRLSQETRRYFFDSQLGGRI